MELVSYIRWTEPGEKERFEQCVIKSKSDADLKERLKQEFSIDNATAFLMTRRFSKFIKNNKKWEN